MLIKIMRSLLRGASKSSLCGWPATVNRWGVSS
jgi:hypothetical protein